MAQVSVTSNGEGTFTVDARFGEQAPIAQAFVLNEMHSATIEAAIRIGLTNMIRDSWAGKAGDDVEARQAAADKIARLLAGDVSGATRGPRKSDEERIRDEYIREIIVRHCKAKSVAQPKGKEDWAKAIAGVYEKNRAAVDKEVARRMRAAPADLEISL